MFSKQLLEWHQGVDRNLPWKETNDPYTIWVSEIILQQTRVSQGMDYFHRFTERFPDIVALAKADEDEVLKTWQGLGYYSRARNMHFTAKYIVSELNGQFPENYEDIIKLKGIGPYTAAAIASFAYGKSHAVVDGNVKRVISRYFGITDDIKLQSTQSKIQELVDQLIKGENPADFNQAIIDFGALQCTPKRTNCQVCPLSMSCYAFANGKVDQIPMTKKRTVQKERNLHYFFLQREGKVYIKKRGTGDIWAGLYELFLIETDKNEIISESAFQKKTGINSHNFFLFGSYTHLLSHQRLKVKFYSVLVKENERKLSAFNLVDIGNLGNFAFPKIIDLFLEEYSINL